MDQKLITNLFNNLDLEMKLKLKSILWNKLIKIIKQHLRNGIMLQQNRIHKSKTTNYNKINNKQA